MSTERIVIGHQNPDTDSICSAIAYADFKARQEEDVTAARCGELNPETEFVLEHFGVEKPELVTDVYTRVGDIMCDEGIKTVGPRTPIKRAGEVLEQKGIKVVPVVNEEEELLGVMTASDIAHRYLEEIAVESLREVPTCLENIIQTLDGEVITSNHNLCSDITGNIFTGAMEPETMKDYINPGDIVLLGDRPKAQRIAVETRVCCLIVTGGLEIAPRVRELADKKGTTIIRVPYDTFASARLINMSVPVEKVMSTEVETFHPDELVEEVKEDIINSRYRSYPVVNRDNKLLGLISARNLINYQRRQVVLVDHNERSQAVEGIKEAELVEVIDHHRLGDLETMEPILVRNEPVGSTATIIAKLYFEYQFEMPPEIAGILLASILSDTVIFRSPTCTEVDRIIATKLAAIVGVEIEEFGRQIFKAGSVLNKDLSDRELILNDFKEYNFSEIIVGVGQIEITDLEEFEDRKDGVLETIHNLKEDRDYDHLFLMVTDILNEGTLLLFNETADPLVQQTFSGEERETGIYLPGVLSRKKQVIPKLSKLLTS